MGETAGAVLIAEHRDRAIYIRPEEISAFRELIELILARPTVAGPPLIPQPLIQLDAALAGAELAGAVDHIQLTSVDEECLMLLRHQMALRDKLPLRIQRTCVTCGKTKIQNPNLITKSKAYENTSSVAGAVLETAGLLAGGHHIRAVIKVMGSVSEIAGKNQKDVPACEDCQGQEFDTPSVTYCPSCRTLRPETILLTCPDCDHSFVNVLELANVWTTPERAYDDFRLTSNANRFTALAPKFENRLYGDQRTFILAKLTPADELIAMCRCSRPGESLRSVALLLTTYQLIWARQLGAGGLTGGTLAWSAVSSVRASAVTVQIESPDNVLAFDGFKNVGVSFGMRQAALTLASFTATGVAALAAELSGVDLMVPAAPPAPAIAAPAGPPEPISVIPAATPTSPAPLLSQLSRVLWPDVPKASAPDASGGSDVPGLDRPDVAVVAAVPDVPAASDVAAAVPFPEPVTWVVQEPSRPSPAAIASAGLPAIEGTQPQSPAAAASAPQAVAPPPVAAPHVPAPTVGAQSNDAQPTSTIATEPAVTEPAIAQSAAAASVSAAPPPAGTSTVSPPVGYQPAVPASAAAPPAAVPAVALQPGVAAPTTAPPDGPVRTSKAIGTYPVTSSPGPGDPRTANDSSAAGHQSITGNPGSPGYPIAAGDPGTTDLPVPVTTAPLPAPPINPQWTGYTAIPAGQSGATTPPHGPASPASGVPVVDARMAVPPDFSNAEPPPPPAAAGWYADPIGQYRYRWWDGIRWTRTFHR